MTFAFGFQCCDVYHANKKSDKPAGRFIRELKTGCKIKKIEQQSFAKKIMAYEDVDREFYTSLKNCKPLNIEAEAGHVGYIINGIDENKCSFRKLSPGFMDTVCNLPLDMTQKYAEEGLNFTRQLDELRAQKKSGSVQLSQYITDINNNKTYCKREYY